MAKYPKKQTQEVTEPPTIAERERGLTPEEKQTVKKIMLRNDKALRMLAEM